MKNIKLALNKIFLCMVFGNYAVDGFYKENINQDKTKYILDSIFPDENTMNIALKAQWIYKAAV